jgi:hypothetical protein
MDTTNLIFPDRRLVGRMTAQSFTRESQAKRRHLRRADWSRETSSLHRMPLCQSYLRVVRAAFLLILPHLRCRLNLVARLLVNLGFCRIRFWYSVASGSGICRETSRIHFWNLTFLSLSPDAVAAWWSAAAASSCYVESNAALLIRAISFLLHLALA